MDVYTKDGETPRLVRTPAQRVAAEFDGFKPAAAEQPVEQPQSAQPAAPSPTSLRPFDGGISTLDS